MNDLSENNLHSYTDIVSQSGAFDHDFRLSQPAQAIIADEILSHREQKEVEVHLEGKKVRRNPENSYAEITPTS